MLKFFSVAVLGYSFLYAIVYAIMEFAFWLGNGWVLAIFIVLTFMGSVVYCSLLNRVLRAILNNRNAVVGQQIP